jgi:hypothetical protein
MNDNASCRHITKHPKGGTERNPFEGGRDPKPVGMVPACVEDTANTQAHDGSIPTHNPAAQHAEYGRRHKEDEQDNQTSKPDKGKRYLRGRVMTSHGFTTRTSTEMIITIIERYKNHHFAQIQLQFKT